MVFCSWMQGAGETIDTQRITDHCSPTAEAVEKARMRFEQFGALRDVVQIADDFDAPLPEDILQDFEGH